jgi:hypothetical protein
METLSPELKAAIQALTLTEKDKLLFRLIRLKPDLIKKLTYELLEDRETLDTRSAKIQADIDKYLESTGHWFTPGNLLMEMRSCNALITEHVKVTKDKMGEVFLTLHLLNQSFAMWRNKLDEFSNERSYTFSNYVITRTAKIMEKAQKLDPIFQEDIAFQFNQLLAHIDGFELTKRIALLEKLPTSYVFVPKKR